MGKKLETRQIHSAFRMAVWNKYIGDLKNLICFCCKYEQISCFNFECFTHS